MPHAHNPCFSLFPLYPASVSCGNPPPMAYARLLLLPAGSEGGPGGEPKSEEEKKRSDC
jgi:hypothetical protein